MAVVSKPIAFVSSPVITTESAAAFSIATVSVESKAFYSFVMASMTFYSSAGQYLPSGNALIIAIKSISVYDCYFLVYFDTSINSFATVKAKHMSVSLSKF